MVLVLRSDTTLVPSLIPSSIAMVFLNILSTKQKKAKAVCEERTQVVAFFVTYRLICHKMEKRPSKSSKAF